MDLTELSSLIYAKQVSSEEVTRRYLDRIEMYDGVLNSFITVCSEEVVKAAQVADHDMAMGRATGVLHGVPFALKDLFWTQGVRTTAGSKQLENDVPTTDAHVWTRLKHAGALLLGKTNMHEFAYGTTTENPHYGATHNPWDLMRIAGGSSGGSAAAVAADLAPASLGTDTGGSIRIPAACSGVVGLKPTFGLVSKQGVIPLAFSLDHVGPMTRSVRDAALLLQLIAGYDPQDSTSVRSQNEQYDRMIGTSLSGLRIGYNESFFFAQTDPQIEERTREVLTFCSELGAQVESVEISNLSDGAFAQNVLIASEALYMHKEWMAESPERYGADVYKRLASGSQYTGVDYAHALDVRLHLQRVWEELFSHIDVFISPTIPFLATPIGDREVAVCDVMQPIRSNLTRFTNPFNLCGLPALSIPCGYSKEGLPIGVQVVGKPFSEAQLLQVGAWIEQGYPTRIPPLFD